MKFLVDPTAGFTVMVNVGLAFAGECTQLREGRQRFARTRQACPKRDTPSGSSTGIASVKVDGYPAAFNADKPRSRSALRSSTFSRPICSRNVGPPGDHLVTVR